MKLMYQQFICTALLLLVLLPVYYVCKLVYIVLTLDTKGYPLDLKFKE